MVTQTADSAPAVQDVEMEDAELLTVQEIREQALQIDKAATSKELRFILRVLRSLPNTRRKLSLVVVRSLAVQLFPAGAEREGIMAYIEDYPEGMQKPEMPRPRAAIKSPCRK